MTVDAAPTGELGVVNRNRFISTHNVKHVFHETVRSDSKSRPSGQQLFAGSLNAVVFWLLLIIP